MEHAAHNKVRSEGPRRNKDGLTPTHIVWTKFELISPNLSNLKKETGHSVK